MGKGKKGKERDLREKGREEKWKGEKRKEGTERKRGRK